MSKEQQSEDPRFTVWSDPKDKRARVQIWDDEFHWDAVLRVVGDFEDLAAKKRFAQAICDILNENAKRIPRE